MRFLNLNFENDIIVSEGEQINIEVWGSDADGDLLSYMVSNSPEDSEFSLAPMIKCCFNGLQVVTGAEPMPILWIFMLPITERQLFLATKALIFWLLM